MSAQFSLKATLGLIPKTSAVEEKEDKLRQEYEDFKSFSESEELARFKELEAFVNSKEFENIKKEINGQKYEGSEPYQKEKRYKELKKSKKIKTYYKVKDSQELKDYEALKDSDKLARFEELDQFFNSPEFEEFKKSLKQQKEEKLREIKEKQAKYKELKKKYGWFFKLKDSKKLEDPKFQETDKYKEYKALEGSDEIDEFLELKKEVTSPEFKQHIGEVKNIKFENTDEYQRLQEYKSLKKSLEIKKFFKFKDSEKLAIYNEMEGSQEIVDFEELEAYINSDEFKKKKEYLKIKDKFKLSEEYKKAEEYKELKNSDKIKWYLKLDKKNDFDKLKEWELTFEDNFEGSKLDTEKWMTGYYWGKNLLNDNYVQANERQFFKESNIEINDSVLKIVTKQEKVKGKVWHPTMGFYPKEFDHSSGLINTGASFKQQYGLFKAKIKVNHSYPVHHAFWLLGERITPEIDIFKYGKKSSSKLEVANYWNGDENIRNNKKSIGGLNFAKDYFIYSLEWTKEKLIWKINDVVMYEQAKGLPDEPMYIVLSSGITQDGNPALPVTMDVDWIRVYKKNEKA